MITPALGRNIAFRIDSLYAGNGRRVGRLKPDSQGVYCGIPMMTLGQVTQQGTYYDPQSMVNQITNPDTHFCKVMKQGKKMGEFGHPTFVGLNKEEMLQRLVTVEEKNTSHLFTSIYTDAPSADGTVVVRANLKPTGPYGAVFKESLDDPMINTAFSLRAYVDTQQRPDGVKYRIVKQLTTFDTVGASGFATSDKAHAIGLESFSGDSYIEYQINLTENGNLLIDQIALESFSDTDLNEIFGVSKISQIVQTRTLVETDKSLRERYPTLYAKSVFNEYFREF